VFAEISVDVIVDNFDYARFLPVAIDSALGQTHPSTRVIVVDDGSTDDSRSIIASYGDRIVPVIKDNEGQASAFNLGFARSSADVILFLDADDVLLPDTVARVARALAGQPDAVKVQYGMEVIDAAGSRTGATKPPPHLSLPEGDVTRDVLAFPFDLTWMPTSGNAFRRSVLQRVLPMPEREFARCADWYLQHITALFGPVISERWIGAQYRVHDRNSYEPSSARLDLDHVRQTVEYAAATRTQILRFAAELGLQHEEILSVSDLANRLISRRLDPPHHPVPSDSTVSLAVSGWRATARRTDVAPTMRAMFRVWFVAMAIAPRCAAVPMAERFLFPERRPLLNHLLARLHRSEPRP
jgi:hypothetical protein